MENEAIVSLKHIKDSPGLFREHIYRYTLSVTRSVAYGRRVLRHDDVLATGLAQVTENFNTAMTPTPGKVIVESMPWLLYLPRFIQPWLGTLESFRKQEEIFNLGNYHETLRMLEKHPDRATVVKDLQENASAHEEDSEMHSATICAEILSVGTETTYKSLLVTIMAMIAFPDVLRKAHEELDRVIGHEKFPTWDDEPQLPYIRAIIKEQQRWRSITPMGQLYN
jgi:cytochrome P450